MKRKINLVGENTLTVSLPAEFVKKQNIKKGQEVDVEEQGNDLVIHTERRHELETVRADIDEIKPVSRRYVDALYKQGVDEIEISYDRESDLNKIKEAISKEVGTFEIVKKSKGICLIKSVSELDKKEQENLLKRTFMLLQEMLSDISEAYKKKSKSKLKDAIELEKINNKLTHLLRRALNKQGNQNYKNTILLYLVIGQLEKAADELRDLCLIADLNSREVLKLLPDLKEFIDLFYKLFYNYNNQLASFFEVKGLEFNKKCKILIKKSSSLEIHYLMNFVEIIYNLSGPIISLKA